MLEADGHHVVRVAPGTTGWAIHDPVGKPATVEGTAAVGLTRWEARQTLGLLHHLGELTDPRDIATDGGDW